MVLKRGRADCDRCSMPLSQDPSTGACSLASEASVLENAWGVHDSCKHNTSSAVSNLYQAH